MLDTAPTLEQDLTIKLKLNPQYLILEPIEKHNSSGQCAIARSVSELKTISWKLRLELYLLLLQKPHSACPAGKN
jgi:hypothetical protein